MNMKRQLTLRFILQLAVAGTIVLLMSAVAVIWMLQKFNEISITRDFASVGLERLVESSELGAEGIRFDPSLLKQVKENGGWLQSLDEKGQVESSYNTPADVPKQYGPGELVAYWTGKQPFAYHLAIWIEQKDGRLYTLVYGAPNIIQPLLTQVSDGGFAAQGGQLLLPDAMAYELRQGQVFVQLLDRAGTELASYNKPDAIPGQYSVQELVLRTLYSDRYGYLIQSSYNEQTKQTWIVGQKNAGTAATGKEPLIPAEAQIVIIGVIAMFAAMLILFLLLSLWQARRFGAPLLHMLVWLDAIGNAVYQEPLDRKGLSRSRMPSGKWRRRYRVFADVILSIDKLSAALQREQELRKQTESLREEWIAGVTHDLKTPLSSITGYAHLLAEPKYEWSQADVRKFSETMLDKSAHMDMLISDLAMTYRLKTGILPPEVEEVELNAWLRDTLQLAADDPLFGKGRIRYQASAQKAVLVQLYTPWLERVVNNITANALLHNSPDTVLTVSLIISDEKRNRGVTIEFADNGGGMDENTLNRLFERYYRGTDTASSPNGSGLGMAIAKGLTEAMGGKITVVTTPGQGTIIRLNWSDIKVRADGAGLDA
ncbi:Signal transduction histidine kinase [Paenibacillus algorifonticola]|uniref:histidine kinase n=1 Tax=Paenibacillus algorifonticola TaxID=684063 RepID=A0A1I2HU84_9BACL|nr:HAMP domain-containing sensor histidine kinase [Paenibacillus algorifonticola]SFF32910.1 Signal transduction histidine kinase [Paenibacillus algorifonticola]